MPVHDHQPMPGSAHVDGGLVGRVCQRRGHAAVDTRPGRSRRPAVLPAQDPCPVRGVGWSSSRRRDHRSRVDARCRAGRSPTQPSADPRPTGRSGLLGARQPARLGSGGRRLVGVAGQQVPQPRLVGDDPDRLGPADRDRVLITVVGQTLRDPVHQRQERCRVARLDPGHQGAQPVPGLGGPHIPLRRRPRRPLLVGLLIDLQQRGVEELLEPTPGEQLDLTGHDRVDRCRCDRGQLTGPVGDLAGLPRQHLTGLDPFPQLRQPVPDVQGVPDQQAGRGHTRLLRQRQRRRARLRHQRSAERAHPHQPVHQHRRTRSACSGSVVSPWQSAHTAASSSSGTPPTAPSPGCPQPG